MAKKGLFYVILTAGLGSTLLNPSAQNLCKKSSGQVKWVAGSSCGGGGWSPINNTLRSGHYRAGSIQDVHISASANIAWTKVAKPSGGIPGSDIATGAIDSSKISDNSIAAIDIGTGAVGQDELEDDSVSTTEIVNETIQNEDIADDAEIDHTKINFTGFQVSNSQIQDGAIDDAKIAIGGIGPNKLQAGAINNSSMFGTGVVPGSALQNGVVTKQKLGLDHLNLPYIVWTGASQGPISAANFYPISGVSPGSTTVGQVFMFVPQDCSKLTFKVQLANAPGGTGKTRTFELVNKDGNSIDPDGSGPLTKMEISLTNTATSQAQTFNVPSHTIQHLALKNSETGGPTTTPATWFIVCE